MYKEQSVDSAGMLKSIMRLMCLFSLFVFTNDMTGLFFNTSAAIETVYDVLHILQYITVLIFIFIHRLDIKKLITGGEKFSVKFLIAAILIGYLTSALGSQLDGLMPRVPVAETPYSLRHILLFMIFAGIMAPVFEEIEFRGLLFGCLKGRIPTVLAILLSSFMFMILHTGGILISAFIVGVFSSIVFLRTKNLLYSMAIHFAGNSVPVMLLGLSLFFQDSGADEVAGMEVETSWTHETIFLILLPAVLLVPIFVFVFIKTRHNKTSEQQNKSKETDPSVLVYFIVYFAICIGSTVIQFLHG